MILFKTRNKLVGKCFGHLPRAQGHLEHTSMDVKSPSTTRNISTNMDPMNAALDELRSQSAPPLAIVARKYGITRSVLSKRFHGKAVSKELKTENDRALNNQQEQQLISWIQRQSDRCLPPTPALVSKIDSDYDWACSVGTMGFVFCSQTQG